MLKIGLIGGLASFHGMTFVQMFNGCNFEKADEHAWKRRPETRLEADARITGVWDSDSQAACECADVGDIETIAEKPEDLIGQVDAIIFPDDGTLKHQKQAFPFLEAGLPCLIDKPLAPEYSEAEQLAEAAEKGGAPLMSCSAIRFARETEAFRAGDKKLGDLITAASVCRTYSGGIVFYGIHAVEMLYSLIGPGAVSVQNYGTEGHEQVGLRWKDGRTFTAIADSEIAHTMEITLFGTEGIERIEVNDSDYYYSAMLKAFLDMAESGKSPVDINETLEIIKVITEAEKSLDEQGSVRRI